jgi:hypothetical protein
VAEQHTTYATCWENRRFCVLIATPGSASIAIQQLGSTGSNDSARKRMKAKVSKVLDLHELRVNKSDANSAQLGFEVKPAQVTQRLVFLSVQSEFCYWWSVVRGAASSAIHFSRAFNSRCIKCTDGDVSVYTCSGPFCLFRHLAIGSERASCVALSPECLVYLNDIYLLYDNISRMYLFPSFPLSACKRCRNTRSLDLEASWSLMPATDHVCTNVHRNSYQCFNIICHPLLNANTFASCTGTGPHNRALRRSCSTYRSDVSASGVNKYNVLSRLLYSMYCLIPWMLSVRDCTQSPGLWLVFSRTVERIEPKEIASTLRNEQCAQNGSGQ